MHTFLAGGDEGDIFVPADIRGCKGERNPRNLPDRSSDRGNKPPLVLVVGIRA